MEVDIGFKPNYNQKVSTKQRRVMSEMITSEKLQVLQGSNI